MPSDTTAFYDDLAEHYHLIFEDWSRSIELQASILGPLLEERLAAAPLHVLDCACGIGTQALGIAARGHSVTASDLSGEAVRRAERETRARNLEISFQVADMRNLSIHPAAAFDAVLAGDNSLPHLLSDDDLIQACESIRSRLKPGGILLATLRDYDSLLESRPTVQGPVFYADQDQDQRRIVHQVWDWDGNEYDVHLYLSWKSGSLWISKHYASRYRALRRPEISAVLFSTGFSQIEWLMPETTSFYQPIVLARKDSEERP